MSTEQIYVTIVRPGKEPVTQAGPVGNKLEDFLVAAGLASADYRNWDFRDEDGEQLTLATTFQGSTSVIAGQRVQGA